MRADGGPPPLWTPGGLIDADTVDGPEPLLLEDIAALTAPPRLHLVAMPADRAEEGRRHDAA